MAHVTFIVTLLVAVSTLCLSKDLSNGWNDKIKWQTLKDALKDSEETKRPVMLVIHKSWCGACKALKPKFEESVDIEELSPHFHMVNALDDDEPKDSKYAPDGGYIPRILFIYEGEVRDDLIHEGGNAKYKYYYHNPEGIVKTMKRAIEKFDLKPPSHTADEL
ncbi:thioredoxin domain-containing protein 12-like [Ruditapes philippinarum]|uniref:thioredoxin domain-containing protein 12-like n=1 Tax=Ruditapes philippinarum TaxID=129788 RepID=UPI00295B7798|nr:thioredoxin domain-containing protein 12-like [Ruditapes philippinarum]